ncbi:hypothetical protein R6Z07M_016314 [Ovis aries]
MGKSRSPRPPNNRAHCSDGGGSGVGIRPRGKRARGVGEEVNPPRGLPRTQGPLSGDAASTRSARRPVGPNCSARNPGNPLRPSSVVPSLPPARPCGRRSRDSRSASEVRDNRARLQPLSTSPSGPVWPGSRNDQLEVPHQRVPFRLLRLQRWSHFKAKPPATPPRAPERPIQAQPRPARLAAATPTVARVTVREGRDSGGERRKPELPAPPSEPEALKPGLEAGGLWAGATPRPGVRDSNRCSAALPRPWEPSVMAESWGPGSALRPAAPPGVRLSQGGLRAPGAGRMAGADTGAALGDAAPWDGGPWPAPSLLPRWAGRAARCPPRRWGR